MALARASALARLALRTQWSAVRLVASEPPEAQQHRREVAHWVAELRRERAQRPPPASAPRSGWFAPPDQRSAPGAADAASCEQDALMTALSACTTVDDALSVLTSARRDSVHPAHVSKAQALMLSLLSADNRTPPAGDARVAALLPLAPKLFERAAGADFCSALATCAVVRITPPADWLQRFWQHSAGTLGGMSAQEHVSLLWACSGLKLHPPEDAWMRHYWAASAAKLGEAAAPLLTATLFACARLQVTPPADWEHAFSRAGEALAPDMPQRELAEMAFFMATLGLWDMPLWSGLWERLCNALSRDIAGWSADDRRDAKALYFVHKAAADAWPGRLPTPGPELLAAAHKCWSSHQPHKKTTR